MKILKKGIRDAIILKYDTDQKYEIVVAYCYDDRYKTWIQGHYFTLWFDQITENKKKELLKKSLILWNKKEYF